jgi:LPXTG-motif cell wall-anchored protein
MTFKDEVTEKAITIKGYNLVSAKEVTITIDENNNVITFYYEKKTDLSYKVEYLEEGTNNKLSEDKVVTGQTFGYTVTEDAITINGYNLVGANQVTITIDEKDNVITFYYTKKTGLNYTVQYLEKDTNNKLSDDKVVNNLVFGTTITENAIDIVGYELDGEVEVTITINETNNVITYYYVKKNINYTIEYYYDDVKDASKTEVLSAPYLSTITTYTDKLIDGYAFDFVLGLPLTIGVDPEDNVIKVYYATDVLRDADKTTDPTDKDGEGSDGIPDKYQKTVIFKVENGLWNDGTNKDIVLIVTLTKDGNNDTTGSANITIPTNMVALKGFVGGAWDKQPSETVYGTNEEVYTYTFDLINKNPQTGDEVNGWIALMISSLSGSIGLTYYSRKKENM